MAYDAAMRRALEPRRARSGHRRQPAGRLRAAERRRRDRRRRLAPRRRHRPRRGRRARRRSRRTPHGPTAVVTLEPCNHHGRTGPCSEALLAAGVAPRRLRDLRPRPPLRAAAPSACAPAASRSSRGVLADEVETLLHRWLTAVRRGRPWVTVKWASTLDGRVAASDGSSKWITGTAARQRVHEQRGASDAILVGTGTVLADDPSLTARGDAGEYLPHQPLPVVVGEREVPADAALRRHPAGAPRDPQSRPRRRSSPTCDARHLRRVYVEGGPTLATAVRRRRLRRRVRDLPRPAPAAGGDRLAIGDLGIPTMADIRRLRIDSVEQLGDDLLVLATPHPQRRNLMFTGIIEELGTVLAWNRSRRRRAPHRPRAARGLRRASTATRSRSAACASPSSTRARTGSRRM